MADITTAKTVKLDGHEVEAALIEHARKQAKVKKDAPAKVVWQEDYIPASISITFEMGGDA